MTHHPRRPILFLGLGVLAAASTALAQPRAAGQRTPGTFSFAVSGRAEHSFDTDLKNIPGSYSVSRVQSGLGVGYFVTEQLRLGLDFENEQSFYDFDAAATFIPGTSKPFSHISTYGLTPNLSYSLDQQWTLIGSGLFDWSQEHGSPDSDGFTGGGLVGVRYALSDDLALTFGLIARSRLEKSTLWLPLVGVEWKIDDTLSLAVRGPGAVVTAKINDQWSAFFDGEFRSREFRLDEDNPLPDGVIRDRRFVVGAGVRYQPAPFFDISLRGGAVVWQEFRVDNNNGDEQREIESDPTPFIGLSATVRF